jgi:hypothetical protein
LEGEKREKIKGNKIREREREDSPQKTLDGGAAAPDERPHRRPEGREPSVDCLFSIGQEDVHISLPSYKGVHPPDLSYLSCSKTYS